MIYIANCDKRDLILNFSYKTMRRCWSKEPHERPTFEQIEEQVMAMLDGAFEDLPQHRLYQFVPIHATEIGGVVKDCGLRNKQKLKVETNDLQKHDGSVIDDGEGYTIKRRFSH